MKHVVAPFGPDRVGLSKELIMKSLQKYVSQVVTFPKWVFTFDLRLSLLKREYAVVIEYGSEMEFRDEFETPEAATIWAKSRARWISASSKEAIRCTPIETTGGKWVAGQSFGLCVFESVVEFSLDPKVSR